MIITYKFIKRYLKILEWWYNFSIILFQNVTTRMLYTEYAGIFMVANHPRDGLWILVSRSSQRAVLYPIMPLRVFRRRLDICLSKLLSVIALVTIKVRVQPSFLLTRKLDLSASVYRTRWRVALPHVGRLMPPTLQWTPYQPCRLKVYFQLTCLFRFPTWNITFNKKHRM